MQLYTQRVSCSADGSIVYALSHADRRLMASRDFGNSWTSLVSDCRFSSFGCSADGKIVYALSNRNERALQRSDDGGATWAEYPAEFSIARIWVDRARNAVVALVPRMHESGLEARSRFSGCLESDDGGVTWKVSEQTYDHSSSPGTFNPHPEDMQAASLDGAIVYEAKGTEYYPPNEDNRVSTLYASRDNGATWLPLNVCHGPNSQTWISVPGRSPDPLKVKIEEEQNKFRLKEPLGWYSNEARELLDRQDRADGGIAGHDFGNGPGKP